MKKLIRAFEICIFISWFLCGIIIACPPPPPCPPCSHWDDGQWRCVYDCGSQSCCNGSCCNGSCCNNSCCANPNWCCEDKKCFDPNSEHCCNNGTGKTCENGQSCCGDGCCSKCEVCVGGICEPKCTSCTKGCDDNGNCIPCDATQCESCVDGQCKVCGGDSTKKCCPDHSCEKRCELEDDETVSCSGETVLCPQGCELFCENHKKIVYTGNKPQRCKEPGCPGDCQDDTEVECSKEYVCIEWQYSCRLCAGLCVIMPGMPQGACEAFTCPSCVTEDPDHYTPNKVPSKKCGS